MIRGECRCSEVLKGAAGWQCWGHRFLKCSPTVPRHSSPRRPDKSDCFCSGGSKVRWKGALGNHPSQWHEPTCSVTSHALAALVVLARHAEAEQPLGTDGQKEHPGYSPGCKAPHHDLRRCGPPLETLCPKQHLPISLLKTPVSDPKSGS